MTRTLVWRALGCALGASLALGCGDGDVIEENPDRIGWSAPQEVDAEDAGPNVAPVIHRVWFTPGEPAAGDRVRAVVEASDKNGDKLELSYLWSIGGDTQRSNGQDLQLGELMPGEEISVEVTASDGRATSEPHAANVRLRNRRPVITKVTLQPGGTVARGKPVTAVAEGRDPDKSNLSFRYEWIVNGRSVEDGPTLDTSSLDPGDAIQVSVIANDGTDDSDPIESASIRVANGDPEIVSAPNATLENGEFVYAVKANDPDGDRNLRYYLKQAPAGMTISKMRGNVRWRPTAAQAGTHPIEIVVEDSTGGRGEQSFELTVASEAEQAPAAKAP